MSYLGLDLTASEKKPSAYAVLDDSGRLSGYDVLATERPWAYSHIRPNIKAWTINDPR